MGMLDTLVHGQTAYLARVAQEVRLRETILGEDQGYEPGHRVVFKRPRTADYRASVHDIAKYLMELMKNEQLRQKMGSAARQRVVGFFDYRVVSKRLVQLLSDKLGIS
jgi:glycosyltransferase involved in cell wall biosynthesis